MIIFLIPTNVKMFSAVEFLLSIVKHLYVHVLTTCWPQFLFSLRYLRFHLFWSILPNFILLLTASDLLSPASVLWGPIILLPNILINPKPETNPLKTSLPSGVVGYIINVQRSATNDTPFTQVGAPSSDAPSSLKPITYALFPAHLLTQYVHRWETVHPWNGSGRFRANGSSLPAAIPLIFSLMNIYRKKYVVVISFLRCPLHYTEI